MPQRALLVVNPASRHGREALGKVESQLEGLGVELVPAPLADPVQMAEIIQRERNGIDRVIVAGGDGTLNTALQWLAGTGLPLGVLPLGTANNLARTLGIPASLEQACRLAAHGARRWIDLGWVNGRYFFTTASIGLSVQITEALTYQTKQRWGALAYAVAALRALARSRPFHAEITWSGGRLYTRTVQVVVGNGRYYGSALPVAEDAAIDDARLDLYSLEVRHWWELMVLIPALRRGRHGEKRSVEVLRATEFEIQTRVPLAVNVDGEICSRTPARFRMMPQALEVFAPADEGRV
jgi:diacylglycerol kinase (ATP)